MSLGLRTSPSDVMLRACVKAWTEYRRAFDDAEPDECWAEFEALANMLPSEKRKVLFEAFGASA